MRSSVVRAFAQINGNVEDTNATCGLDVMDAVYHTAHDFPGGVPALAQRMVMSHNTLAHKVSLTTTTHHLSLREAVTLQAVSGDVRILHAMADALGYRCINLQANHEVTTLSQVMAMVKDFGDMLGVVTDAVQDGTVSPNEMQDCERRAAELLAAVGATLAAVRAMMPKQQGVTS